MMIFAVAAFAFLSGCTPAGPRALISGDELLREGNVSRAVPKLEEAVKLLPNEPRAWNLLGVAYHRTGQPKMAVQAYQQALAKDRSNLVAVAHYNLGCLLLEQNNPAAAMDELRSFTLITNSSAGLVKLATAQMRLRQFDAAERNFNSALRNEPKNFEALNGLGVIHAYRQQRDAPQLFNAALEKNPKYAPALLNAGLLAQQNPAARPAALQRFRDFVAAAPQAPQAETVKLLVRQLETELAPARPVAPLITNVTQNTVLKTNTLLTALQTTNALQPTSSPPRILASNVNAKPPVVAVKTNALVPPTNQFVAITNPPVVATNNRVIAREPVRTNPPPPIESLPITVVALTNESRPLIAPPEPIVIVRESNAVVEPAIPPVTLIPPDGSRAATNGTDSHKKPGFLTRLNPFREKPKPAPPAETRLVVVTPRTNVVSEVSPKPSFPRYQYRNPAPPAAGNRRDAERVMAQGAKAQRAGNTNEAMLDFQLAVSADPGYFDGQYNFALLAYQTGDLPRSLASWETALALQPESINSRYNFALALKQGNYAYDAANELQKILEAKPDEARAHLTLGNLYAQQIKETDQARVHYTRVLELDPRNPQAAAIRFWLAANR